MHSLHSVITFAVVAATAVFASSASADQLAPLTSANSNPYTMGSLTETESILFKISIDQVAIGSADDALRSQPPPAVPMPSAVGMGLIGLGAVAGRRRRRG